MLTLVGSVSSCSGFVTASNGLEPRFYQRSRTRNITMYGSEHSSSIGMAVAFPVRSKRAFDPAAFVATICEGRKAGVFPRVFPKKQPIFAQGDAADAVFYLWTGKVRLTVVSKTGKEATIAILNDGSFFREGSLAGQARRMGTATAMTDSVLAY